MKRFLASITLFSMALAPFAARAEDSFDPNFVLSDADLTDTSVPDDFAQRFLEARGGAIASRMFADIDGTLKKPGDLITYYGKVYGVNPRFLLALIQKEQSLVYDKNPSTCQVDWAAGYGRPDGSTCNDPVWQKYRGFTSQIINAAAFVRYIYDKEKNGEARTFGYFPNRAAVIDGSEVTPANTATAILYTYTPHIHGNRNLLKIWSGWFRSSYPDGTYLSDARGEVYVIQGGLKRRFASKGALRSRVDMSRVIRADTATLASFEEGAPIKFSEYSLLRVPDGTIYLISGDTKRPIASMEAFRKIGFNPEEIEEVEAADLEAYATAEAITATSVFPTGALLQNRVTGGVYYVEAGVKHPILSIEIMKANYPGRKLSPVAPEALASYPDGAPARFKDGELVMSPKFMATVFVISNGARRAITSGELFEKLGYDWKRIIRTSDKALELHPEGEPLAVPDGQNQAQPASAS